MWSCGRVVSLTVTYFVLCDAVRVGVPFCVCAVCKVHTPKYSSVGSGGSQRGEVGSRVLDSISTSDPIMSDASALYPLVYKYLADAGLSSTAKKLMKEAKLNAGSVASASGNLKEIFEAYQAQQKPKATPCSSEAAALFQLGLFQLGLGFR